MQSDHPKRMAHLLPNSICVVTAVEDKKGLKAAIVTAITAYLEEEERARLAVLPEPRPLAPISLWRIFGRREVMRSPASWRRRMV
jgi:hypothetical protein